MNDWKKFLFVILLLIIACDSLIAETPLWMRDVRISPNGENIAFSYKGDIWIVSSAGGDAFQLTSTDNTYEDHPIWSPDGKTISFSSDRSGNFDIYTIPSEGGEIRRITFNSTNEKPEAFSPDGNFIFYSASIQDPAASALFPEERMTELYSIPINGGKPIIISHVPIENPVFHPAKKDLIFFQDYKGIENEWRKHHKSSITKDIWSFNLKSKKYNRITTDAGDEINPVISPDGKFLFFLKENDDNNLNIFKYKIGSTEEPIELTNFKDHPIRFLSSSDNGTLCFSYDGEIYLLSDSSTNPEKVDINISLNRYNPIKKMDIFSLEEAVPSPNGKEMAFISRGEVFVTSMDFSTTKQITRTPYKESNLSWSPDGNKLIYTSDREGHLNVYMAEKGREEDIFFSSAIFINETPLFDGADNIDRDYAKYSPDGQKISFVKDRRKLCVYDFNNCKEIEILNGETHKSVSDGFKYQWSPDSKWILSEGILHNNYPYFDILLVGVDNTEIIPLTETGYFDRNPKFVLNGDAVVFSSDRYGMRNQSSWGSEFDIFMIFLNDDAYDKFLLSSEQANWMEDNHSSNQNSLDSKNNKDVFINLEGLQDRLVRITPNSCVLSDYYVSENGDNLFYMAAFNEGYDLWRVNLRDKKVEMAKKLGAGSADLIGDNTGQNLYLMSSNSLRRFDLRSFNINPINFSCFIEVDENMEREHMFDYVKTQEQNLFYDANMHNVDWDGLAAHYKKFLPHINNNYDFAELLSELLGELNVSHTGARFSMYNNRFDNTASLGLLFDLSKNDDRGLIVTEVLRKGPADKSGVNIEVGDILTAINGNNIAVRQDWAVLLNNIAGKKTLISYIKKDGTILEDIIIPISLEKERELLYDRWVKKRQHQVDSLSEGRLGYVHVRAMDDRSFRKIYADMMGKFNDKEGMIVDIRWNSGGRLHEDLEILLTGDKYLSQIIRGEEIASMPSKRWFKPSILLQNEACYSNAHGTAWLYKEKGVGKLVGTPVPGTMTTVNWMKLQDPSITFGIPTVGFQLEDGSFLENTQLEPDIYVLNSPESLLKGEDTQLNEAVKQLLMEISH